MAASKEDIRESKRVVDIRYSFCCVDAMDGFEVDYVVDEAYVIGAFVDVLFVALLGRCEVCGEAEGVEWEASCTNYHCDGELAWQFRNRPVLLCRDCAADHYAYWDEMWETVYNNG